MSHTSEQEYIEEMRRLLGQAIREKRGELSQRDLGHILGREKDSTAQTYISRLENGDKKLSMDDFFSLCFRLNCTPDSLLSVPTSDPDTKGDGPHNKDDGSDWLRFTQEHSDEHVKRLNRFSDSEFIGYYISTAHNRHELTHLTIKTVKDVNHQGFLAGTAETEKRDENHDNYHYATITISPTGGTHTYFYLSEKDSRSERASIVLPWLRSQAPKYYGGIGVLLSRSTGSEPTLCFQKIVLYNSKFFSEMFDVEREEIEDRTKAILELDAAIIGKSKYYFTNLEAEDKRWYQEFVRPHLQK